MTEERVSIKIRLKYQDLRTFQQRFAPFIGQYGMFLPMRQLKPIHTPLLFEIFLADGARIFHGEGIVVATYPPSQHTTPGIGLRFTALDTRSQQLLNRLKQQNSPRSELVPALEPMTISLLETEEEAPTAATPPTARTSEAKRNLPLFFGKEEEIPATGPIIGIDLGTTNSCCAIVENTRPRVIPSRYGYNTIPSIVAYDERHNLLVGHPGKSQMLLNPHNTVYGSKRLVGRKYHSPIVQIIKNRFHYNIVESYGGDAGVQISNEDFSLQEISALILAEIREIAQGYLQQPIYRAVISVPAYYNDNQRQAVRRAGLLAGLRVERIVNEPTAAALAYGFGRGLEQRLLVYDLGGGTFDASVLHIHHDIYEVLSTGGNTFLGGVDFDNRLIDFVLKRFEQENQVNLHEDAVKMQRVKDAVEKIKCDLSTETRAELVVPYIAVKDGKPIDIRQTITREQLNQLTEDLVEETIRVCDEVLKAHGLNPQDLDEVILVGGQTRMPLIHERLAEHFGQPPHRNVHPDEAVALGTALLAYSFGRSDQLRLIDVLAMSIGVGLPGGRFKPIVKRNTKLPFQKNYTIATTRDNQTELDIVIFQGESDNVRENEYLGTLSLRGIPPAPKSKSRFEIRFHLNNECILTVTAINVQTGERQEVTLSTRHTPDELRQKLDIPEEEQAVQQPTQQHDQTQAPPDATPDRMADEPPVSPSKGGVLGWLKRLFRR